MVSRLRESGLVFLDRVVVGQVRGAEDVVAAAAAWVVWVGYGAWVGRCSFILESRHTLRNRHTHVVTG